MAFSREEQFKNELDEYMSDCKIAVEKGNKFLKWILLNVFDKTESELDDNDIESGVLISDGCGDKGIDAAFVLKGSLYIIQSKYGASHSIEDVASFISKMRNLLNKDENYWGHRIDSLYNIIFDEESDINDIQFFYITNNNINVDLFKNDLENFEEHMPEKCGKNCRFCIMGIKQILEYLDEQANSIPLSFKGKKTKLLIENFFENQEHTTIVAEIALKNIARFVKNDKEYLYYSNIRNFLGKGGKINKKMVDTFSEHPKDFWYYNNGITIVCDNFELKEKNKAKELTIETPQIVNGCQTANVIYTEWNAIRDIKKRNEKEGTILVKIIKDTNDKRKDITRYTNSQNAVTGKDFFALENFHRDLKKDFEKLGYNYEIQRNANILKESKNKIKGNIKYIYLFDKQFNKKNTLIAKEVIQAYVSGILLLPAKAKSIGNFIPGGQYYDSTFNDKTPTDPRIYLYAYSIMYYGNYKLDHKKDDRKKASNLLFISIYFRLIFSMLEKLKIIDDTYTGTQSLDNSLIDILDNLFVRQSLNVQLIEQAEEILYDRIFDDTAIIELIGDNLPKFLKATIESDKCIKIINDKINSIINKKSFEPYLNEIKEILL